MSSILVTNIRKLVNVREHVDVLHGHALAQLPCIDDAWLLIEEGRIGAYGTMRDLELSATQWRHQPTTTIDARGRYILPAWCDSHTHIVFAGSREDEFVDKIKGASYAEIAAKGGGILHSAKNLNATPEEVLFEMAAQRLHDVAKMGTGAIEIKSGYGLTLEGELKMLRVIARLKERSPLLIKSTFLGAHAYPPPFENDHAGYVNLLVREMLPAIAAEHLADYVDVFCERGFFSPEDTLLICAAATRHGLKQRLHVNQLSSCGGVAAGLQANALSLDHLETLSENDIDLLSTASRNHWRGVCTLLPTAAFFLRLNYPPARALIDRGCAVALASDFNPGSSPSGNMNLVLSMACIQMKMLPEEAINAATVNGAYAIDLLHETGSITRGKRANLILTKEIPSLNYLPYAFGTNHIERVMLNGEFV